MKERVRETAALLVSLERSAAARRTVERETVPAGGGARTHLHPPRLQGDSELETTRPAAVPADRRAG